MLRDELIANMNANILARLKAIRTEIIDLCELTRDLPDHAHYYALVDIQAAVDAIIRQMIDGRCQCIRVVCIGHRKDFKIYHCPECGYSFEHKSQWDQMSFE
jgi:hypothetical protein